MTDEKAELPQTLLAGIPSETPNPSASPPRQQRDEALGHFMDSWSQLEASVRSLLSMLTQAPDDSAFSIAAAIPDIGRMKELLESLAVLYLEKDDQKQLQEILDYLLLSSRYRNRIVHGQWMLTNNRDRKIVMGTEYRFMWIRVYIMPDKNKEAMAALGRDSKAEEQFVFTVERLQERARKADALAERIYAFSDHIRTRIKQPQPRP